MPCLCALVRAFLCLQQCGCSALPCPCGCIWRRGAGGRPPLAWAQVLSCVGMACHPHVCGSMMPAWSLAVFPARPWELHLACLVVAGVRTALYVGCARWPFACVDTTGASRPCRPPASWPDRRANKPCLAILPRMCERVCLYLCVFACACLHVHVWCVCRAKCVPPSAGPCFGHKVHAAAACRHVH